MRHKFPFFHPNGCIIVDQKDADTYQVDSPHVTVFVDTDTPLDAGGYAVEVPPTWLHTEEEYAEVASLASQAVEDYIALIYMEKIMPTL